LNDIRIFILDVTSNNMITISEYDENENEISSELNTDPVVADDYVLYKSFDRTTRVNSVKIFSIALNSIVSFFYVFEYIIILN
jgi:hypothetical protein